MSPGLQGAGLRRLLPPALENLAVFNKSGPLLVGCVAGMVAEVFGREVDLHSRPLKGGGALNFDELQYEFRRRNYGQECCSRCFLKVVGEMWETG